MMSYTYDLKALFERLELSRQINYAEPYNPLEMARRVDELREAKCTHVHKAKADPHTSTALQAAELVDLATRNLINYVKFAGGQTPPDDPGMTMAIPLDYESLFNLVEAFKVGTMKYWVMAEDFGVAHMFGLIFKSQMELAEIDLKNFIQGARHGN